MKRETDSRGRTGLGSKSFDDEQETLILQEGTEVTLQIRTRQEKRGCCIIRIVSVQRGCDDTSTKYIDRGDLVYSDSQESPSRYGRRRNIGVLVCMYPESSNNGKNSKNNFNLILRPKPSFDKLKSFESFDELKLQTWSNTLLTVVKNTTSKQYSLYPRVQDR